MPKFSPVPPYISSNYISNFPFLNLLPCWSPGGAAAAGRVGFIVVDGAVLRLDALHPGAVPGEEGGVVLDGEDLDHGGAAQVGAALGAILAGGDMILLVHVGRAYVLEMPVPAFRDLRGVA